MHALTYTTSLLFMCNYAYSVLTNVLEYCLSHIYQIFIKIVRLKPHGYFDYAMHINIFQREHILLVMIRPFQFLFRLFKTIYIYLPSKVKKMCGLKLLGSEKFATAVCIFAFHLLILLAFKSWVRYILFILNLTF